MPESSAKPQLPLFDFAIPLIVKVPMVLLSEFLLPTLIVAAIFYGLRGLGLLSASDYLGKVFFALILGFCIFAALRFNSIEFVRRLCAERKSNPIFHIPHPIVEDLQEGERPVRRVKKVCAIAFIETKAYTIAYGVVFIIFYFCLLYFLRGYDPVSLKCAHSCDVFRFGIKSIGSGVVFDFFDAFHIELSDITNGSTYFLVAAFLAKLVFAGLVLRIVTSYFRFRKKYRSVLRTSAISFDKERIKETLSKVDPKILEQKRMYFFLPPWLRRRR